MINRMIENIKEKLIKKQSIHEKNVCERMQFENSKVWKFHFESRTTIFRDNNKKFIELLIEWNLTLTSEVW